MLEVVVVILLALFFDFTNGWHDTANSIATVVGTRTLTPRSAVLMSATLNLAGAFLSTEVAKTIGKEIINPNVVTQKVIIAGLFAAIIWNIVTVMRGIPTSSSHALIGGLIGSAVAYSGIGILKLHGIMMILIFMLIAPLFGGLLSFIVLKIIKLIFLQSSRLQIIRFFRPLQVISSGYMSFSHGAADAQKTMGIITLSLFAAGYQQDLSVQTWVIFSAGFCIALGTAIGGSKIVRTLGTKLSKLQTPQGFAAEMSSGTILATLAHAGLPVSTSHTITGAILGTGAAERVNSVNWGMAAKILYAWLLTFPGTILIGYLFYLCLEAFY